MPIINTTSIQRLINGGQKNLPTRTEEVTIELPGVIPFLVEDLLKKNSGNYSKTEDWQSDAFTDGKLITGQNPGIV